MAEYKPYTEDLQKFKEESDDIGNVKSIKVWSEQKDVLPPIKKIEILDFGDEGFLLKNVLSQSECKHFIGEGENLEFDDIPEAKESYRNCKRILLRSEELSDLLWRRLHPYLKPVSIEGDPHKVHIHGIEALLQGKWEPLELNNLFRFCRYFPGGHFAPHFDGHFVRSPEVRSMKTLMLYLNGDFEGGTTNFVDEKQTLFMNDKGKYCAEDSNILYRVKPEPGMAIIFNHHRLHEGQALRSGVKYILRTDILYKRTGGPHIDTTDAEAFQIVQEAERLEAKGENMAAMQLYRKAFKMSPSLATSYGCPP